MNHGTVQLHLLFQFNWLARYHSTPNFIFPLRLRSLSLDFIGAMNGSAGPTPHGLITETILNYLLDDKDYLMLMINEISIKPYSSQSRTCVQNFLELITSHSSKIKLFSCFNTDELPRRFRSVIMHLAHCTLKILEIPLSDPPLFLNGSGSSLCSLLRRLSLHADGNCRQKKTWRFASGFVNVGSNHEREQWLSDVHRAFDTFFRNGRKGNRSDTIRSIHV